MQTALLFFDDVEVPSSDFAIDAQIVKELILPVVHNQLVGEVQVYAGIGNRSKQCSFFHRQLSKDKLTRAVFRPLPCTVIAALPFFPVLLTTSRARPFQTL